MLEAVSAGETHSHSPPLCAGNMAELRSVGQVEISDEATLEDLKTQVGWRLKLSCLYKFGQSFWSWSLKSKKGTGINNHCIYIWLATTWTLAQLCFLLLYQVLTLPALQDVCVPTSAFMRVWLLEGRRLARILRGQQLTLRYKHVNRVYTLLCPWRWPDCIYYWSMQMFWVIAWFHVSSRFRKLKLTSGTDLCVQQLLKEEDLG